MIKISLVVRGNIIPRRPWKAELGFSCPPQGGKSNSFQNTCSECILRKEDTCALERRGSGSITEEEGGYCLGRDAAETHQLNRN